MSLSRSGGESRIELEFFYAQYTTATKSTTVGYLARRKRVFPEPLLAFQIRSTWGSKSELRAALNLTVKVYFNVKSHQVVIYLLFSCHISQTGPTELKETYPECAAGH